LFDQRGYERVSIREIAERAGITQAAVFRHFGTKGDLYIEAVSQPFYGFVTGYLRRWIDGGHGSGTSLHHTEVFVDGLHHLLLDNRPLPAALAGQVGDAQERIQSKFLQDVLDRVEREVTVETRVRGNETMDAGYAVRFAVALVYGVTILDDTLFPVGDRAPCAAGHRPSDGCLHLRGSLVRGE
jgi:AcrR family transcriptional regulator